MARGHLHMLCSLYFIPCRDVSHYDQFEIHRIGTAVFHLMDHWAVVQAVIARLEAENAAAREAARQDAAAREAALAAKHAAALKETKKGEARWVSLLYTAIHCW